MSKKSGKTSWQASVVTLLLALGPHQDLVVAATQKGVGGLKTIDQVVAIVNDDVITESELASYVRITRTRLRNNKVKLPSDILLRKQVLERMILEQIQVQRAEKSGISVTDKDIEKTIDDIARRNKVGRDRFMRQVYRDGYNKDSYRKALKKQILTKRLVDKVIKQHIRVSESEVDKFIVNRNRISGGKDAYNLSHIMIPIPESPSPEKLESVKQKAMDILKKLEKGTDFQQTAIAHSTGEKALEGGNLGWRSLSELPEIFLSSLSEMGTGDISKLIQSPNGFHILKLNDLRTATKRKTVQQSRVRHILVRTDEITTDEDALNRLSHLRQRILDGEDFGVLAQSHSDDKGTAIKGGELSWVNPGDTVKEFEGVMSRLKIGDISNPVKTAFGYHIIQVLERRKRDIGRQLDRAQARSQLRNKKTEENYQQWVRQIRHEAYVKYIANWAVSKEQ